MITVSTIPDEYLQKIVTDESLEPQLRAELSWFATAAYRVPTFVYDKLSRVYRAWLVFGAIEANKVWRETCYNNTKNN
jgi:hypothetical protein